MCKYIEFAIGRSTPNVYAIRTSIFFNCTQLCKKMIFYLAAFVFFEFRKVSVYNIFIVVLYLYFSTSGVHDLTTDALAQLTKNILIFHLRTM